MNMMFHIFKLPETNLAPENGWLEDEDSFWTGPFSGAILVLGRGAHVFFEGWICWFLL